MSGACTREFCCILARFHERDRICADFSHTASAFKRDDKFFGSCGCIKTQREPLFARLFQIAVQLIGRAQCGELFQHGPRLRIEFSRIEIKTRLMTLDDQSTGQRQRRMRHIRATNIECPSHGMRIADEETGDILQRLFNARELLRCVFTGIFFRMQ